MFSVSPHQLSSTHSKTKGKKKACLKTQHESEREKKSHNIGKRRTFFKYFTFHTRFSGLKGPD
jgi:hypothetical protein